MKVFVALHNDCEYSHILGIRLTKNEADDLLAVHKAKTWEEYKDMAEGNFDKAKEWLDIEDWYTQEHEVL